MVAHAADILIEIAAAADPRRADAARRRLEALAVSAPPSFDNLVSSAAARPLAAPAPRADVGTFLKQAPAAVAHKEKAASSPYRALGVLLLQKAFETMMPAAQAEGASRSASGLWRSMLAQRLADAASASVFPAEAAIASPAAPQTAKVSDHV